MAEPVRHRQTKGAATDMFDLPPPRHISTLRNSVVRHVLAKDGSTTLCRHRLPPSEDESRTAAEGTMSGRARLLSGEARQAYQRRPPSRGASPERYRAKLAPGDLDDGSRCGAIVSRRVVIPPATPYSQSAGRPAAKLTVQLDQFQRGAFDNIAVVHGRIAYGPGAEITVNK
jgi:hypothetical protein